MTTITASLTILAGCDCDDCIGDEDPILTACEVAGEAFYSWGMDGSDWEEFVASLVLSELE